MRGVLMGNPPQNQLAPCDFGRQVWMVEAFVDQCVYTLGALECLACLRA